MTIVPFDTHKLKLSSTKIKRDCFLCVNIKVHKTLFLAVGLLSFSLLAGKLYLQKENCLNVCTIALENNIQANFKKKKIPKNPNSCVLFIPHPGCEKIRLAGASGCSGRVEVFYDNKWGTVCDDNWGLANAKVACRELQCGAAHAAKGSAFFGQGQGDIWLDDVEETSIFQCNHKPFGTNNCGHGEDVGVICSGQSTHCCLTTVQCNLRGIKEKS